MGEQIGLESRYMMNTYRRKPIEFVRGEGMLLWDDAGREYLDFHSGIGAVSLGHCDPDVTAAVRDQIETLVHVGNYYYVENRGELAREIDGLLGGGWRTFFANSGAEANEGAIKVARKWAKQHKPGAYKVVTAYGSFHGRTLATLAATAQPAKQETFQPLPDGFLHVPLNDIDALEAIVDETVCGVLLEPIQGEGGVWPCTQEYLEAARRICDEKGALLIFDEVQTGYFRTGPAFAFQLFGVVPDVVAQAKGMGNGYPIGAFSARGDAAVALEPGDHGTTFGGSPVVCAASLATVKGLTAMDAESHVSEVGGYLKDALEALPGVASVHGAGLMVGVSLDRPIAPEVMEAALDRGIVMNAIGTDILRLLPPLICGTEHVDTFVEVLRDLLETIGAQR